MFFCLPKSQLGIPGQGKSSSSGHCHSPYSSFRHRRHPFAGGSSLQCFSKLAIVVFLTLSFLPFASFRALFEDFTALDRSLKRNSDHKNRPHISTISSNHSSGTRLERFPPHSLLVQRWEEEERGMGKKGILLAAAFPFQGFPGAGGGPPPPPTTRKRKPDPDYYAYLELDQADAASISDKEIKQQYRKLSRKYHPDASARKGGEGEEEEGDAGEGEAIKGTHRGTFSSSLPDTTLKEKYIRIQKAYEVLSDPKKRKMFDLQGEAGLEALEKYEEVKKDIAGGGGRQKDPLTAMLQQMGGVVGENINPFQANSKEMGMRVPLSDILTGASKVVEYQKQCICTACKGRGGEARSPTRKCPMCKGKGSVITRMQLAPGMVQQVMQPCGTCEGHGEVFAHPCAKCRGKGVMTCSVRKLLDIPKGAQEGERLIFPMEGDEEAGKVPGDIILKLETTSHESFTRRSGKGSSDLDTSITISLPEALLGFRREMTHIDGREKVVLEREQQITPFGHVLKIQGKGLPHGGGQAGRGDLYVQVNCHLPTLLTGAQKEAIAAAFNEEKSAGEEEEEKDAENDEKGGDL